MSQGPDYNELSLKESGRQIKEALAAFAAKEAANLAEMEGDPHKLGFEVVNAEERQQQLDGSWGYRQLPPRFEKPKRISGAASRHPERKKANRAKNKASRKSRQRNRK